MGDRRHACNMLNKETLWHRPGISTTGGITLHNIELTERVEYFCSLMLCLHRIIEVQSLPKKEVLWPWVGDTQQQVGSCPTNMNQDRGKILPDADCAQVMRVKHMRSGLVIYGEALSKKASNVDNS